MSKTEARRELNQNKVGVAVRCAVCGMTKCPVGRSAPFGAFLCDRDCAGYEKAPFPGSLWPRESEADFGYPVADVGTIISQGARSGDPASVEVDGGSKDGCPVSATRKPEMAPQEHDVTTWPENLQFLFRERAAIREFDGKQDRETAEAASRTEVWARREEM